jgi:hypothetical protein
MHYYAGGCKRNAGSMRFLFLFWIDKNACILKCVSVEKLRECFLCQQLVSRKTVLDIYDLHA